MADLNLKVGDFVRLRRGDVVGPLVLDEHLHYPWGIADKPHLCWTPEGRWEEGSFSSKLNGLDIVGVVTPAVAPDKDDQPTAPDDVVQLALETARSIPHSAYANAFVRKKIEEAIMADRTSRQPIKQETNLTLPVNKDEICRVINLVLKKYADLPTSRSAHAISLTNAVMDVIQDKLNATYESISKQDAAPKSEGGPSDTSGFNPLHIQESAADAEPMRLYGLDDIEPVTRAFLQSLYPSAPLRAIEVKMAGESYTSIEVSFGRPMDTKRTINLISTAAVPLWVK